MADIEVTAHVDASPTRVWELIGDPTRMGEWSPECRRVNWTSGSSHATVGARFKGHNRNGWRRWTTTGTLVEVEADHAIAWDVKFGMIPVARWAYRIQADDDGRGCTVTETFDDHRSSGFKVVGKPARGVSDAAEHNRRGMEATLERVKAAAEAQQP